ncbi:hypothetical protein Pan181_32670 [Aeoliella mucimassa]|uniref:Bacterial Pleckstrin homology domain-containing protein n=2 Tax=Aeoliella mucimassa TaxID=2527972 RepID=A0A518AQS3_9BACT|nr:hypothetical protein Pan181_32670 [Aeoliella mucimassa]
MDYEHTQHSPLHWLLLVPAGAMLLSAAWATESPAVVAVLLGSGLITGVLGFSFGRLTVRDEGSRLAIEFGPLPLFRKTVEYHEITDVCVARSSWIDGWGIHWMPGRGTTYNLWGFDCVELQLGNQQLRVGTDEAENLAEFLRQRLKPR